MKKIKSGTAYVSCMWETINTYTIPCGISEEKMYLQNLGIRENNITMDLKKLNLKLYTVLNWLRISLTGAF
jgi:hypothetical protein